MSSRRSTTRCRAPARSSRRSAIRCRAVSFSTAIALALSKLGQHGLAGHDLLAFNNLHRRIRRQIDIQSAAKPDYAKALAPVHLL